MRINVLYTYHILLLLQEIYNDKREIYGCSMVKGKKTTRQKEFIFQRKWKFFVFVLLNTCYFECHFHLLRVGIRHYTENNELCCVCRVHTKNQMKAKKKIWRRIKQTIQAKVLSSYSFLFFIFCSLFTFHVLFLIMPDATYIIFSYFLLSIVLNQCHRCESEKNHVSNFD